MDHRAAHGVVKAPILLPRADDFIRLLLAFYYIISKIHILCRDDRSSDRLALLKTYRYEYSLHSVYINIILNFVEFFNSIRRTKNEKNRRENIFNTFSYYILNIGKIKIVPQ